MQSDKSIVRDLVSILVTHGLKHVVISPGSRHAPLSLSCYNHPEITCHVVPDERAAAYFALGIIQQTTTPVACICTSGTDLANYTSAAAEAFYQELPLIFLSADRPAEWVDQGDGQTIRQDGLLAAHCLGSWNLTENDVHADVRWFNQREINRAWNTATGTPQGPIHINIPLREPLYQLIEERSELPVITNKIKGNAFLHHDALNRLASVIRSKEKVLLIIGLQHPNPALSKAVGAFSLLPQVTVMTETTSNIHHGETISCIDRFLMSLSEDEQTDFIPELLITVGTHIISKKIKAFLRSGFSGNHWHIGEAGEHMDTFKRLDQIIQANPTHTLSELAKDTENPSDYHDKWFDIHLQNASIQQSVIADLPWCDMKVFESILETLPDQSNLQMGNSSIVRYIQLYNMNHAVSYFGNRGTSGIDGSTSTAAGMAAVSSDATILITGDISFFYDINGLWHQEHLPNLKIILINNGGGGIFKIIDGPRSTNALDDVFVAKHTLSAQHLAEHFGLEYQLVGDEVDLKSKLNWLHEPGLKLLEVDTKTAANDDHLRSVFKAVKKRRNA